jgi:hypothetical protein
VGERGDYASAGWDPALTRLCFKRAPPRPDLDALMKRAAEEFEALSPEQKREHRAAQRRSWVIGEMLLEHPELTREYVEKLYDSCLSG